MGLLHSALRSMWYGRGGSPRARIVVSHYDDASYWRPGSELFMHIQGGRAGSGRRLQMPGDDTGEHISGKNASFGELTVLYWAWKNMPGIDVVGFCHYRRYFLLDPRYPDNLCPPHGEQASLEPALTHTERLARIGESDVLVTKARRFEHATIESQYKATHRPEDFDAMVDAVLRCFPDYAQSHEAFVRSSSLFCCNMFVARSKFFDRYMRWLFAVLSDLEPRIALELHGYQRRTFAFLAERLLNWHLIHLRITEQLQIHELGVAFLDEVAYRRTFVRY